MSLLANKPPTVNPLLAVLEGRWMFTLTELPTSAQGLVQKQGVLDVDKFGQGAFQLNSYTGDGPRPVTFDPPNELGNGRVTFNFHQEQGVINGTFFLTTDGTDMWLCQGFGQGGAGGQMKRMAQGPFNPAS